MRVKSRSILVFGLLLVLAGVSALERGEYIVWSTNNRNYNANDSIKNNLFSLSLSSARFSGQPCRGRNNAPGVCQLIYECRQALTDIKAGLGKVLCKTGELIDVVCCPTGNGGSGGVPANVAPVTTRTPTVDLTQLRLSERSEWEFFFCF